MWVNRPLDVSQLGQLSLSASREMSSELQLDVCHLNWWWHCLVKAYEVWQAWCSLQVNLCDPCLSALKWFVYHARRYTTDLLYFTFITAHSPVLAAV